MSDPDDRSIPIEYKLIHDSSLLDIEVIESDANPTVGDEDWHVRMQLQVDEELVDSCAHGLIFAVGVLSFHDARPRGVSGEWFEDGDQFSASDMLNHITLERGKLHMYVDYLRGRCVKTTVEIGSDGKVLLETVNRGKAALKWIARLQGKKLLQTVPDEP
ncbi:MAG: hypothetical protein WDO69_33785 [Pseudomonadota bacterium]